MTEFTLSALVTPTSNLPSFALPVFERDGKMFLQEIGVQNEISNFHLVSKENFENWRNTKRDIARKIGDPSVWSFVSDNQTFLGRRHELEAHLEEILAELNDHPFVAIEALNFLERYEDLPPAVVRAAATMISSNERAAIEWATMEQKGSHNYVLSELAEIREKRRTAQRAVSPSGSIFSEHQPLGPIVFPEHAKGASFGDLVLSDIASFHELRPSSSIIVGRRGTGKTTALFHLSQINQNQKHVIFRLDRALSIVSGLLSRLTNFSPFVEQISEFWRYLIWAEVAQSLHDSPDLEVLETNAYFDFYQTWVSDVSNVEPKGQNEVTRQHSLANFLAKSSTEGSLFGVLQKTNELARETENFLETNTARVLVTIDSLETYPLQSEFVRLAMAGLLKVLGSFNLESRMVHLVLAVPEAHYRDLMDISANPSKDFSQSTSLIWRPTDLIRLVLWRLSYFLRIQDHPRYSWLVDKLAGGRDDLRTAWHAFFPDTLVNTSGRQESSIAYLIRHTQMTPRQLLYVLNGAFRLKMTRPDTGSTFPLRSEDIVDSVRSALPNFVDDTLAEYKDKYPLLRNLLERTFPNVSNLTNNAELHRAFNRHARAVDPLLEFHDFIEILIEIGALGRVVDGEGMYASAVFSFSSEMRLVVNHQDTLCIHPIFAEVFRVQNFEAKDVYRKRCLKAV